MEAERLDRKDQKSTVSEQDSEVKIEVGTIDENGNITGFDGPLKEIDQAKLIYDLVKSMHSLKMAHEQEVRNLGASLRVANTLLLFAVKSFGGDLVVDAEEAEAVRNSGHLLSVAYDEKTGDISMSVIKPTMQ